MTVAELYQALQMAQPYIFGVLTIAALVSYRKHRDPAAKWLVLSFLSLGGVVITAQFLPETHDPGVEIIRKIEVVILLLFPYFLFRFAASFQKKVLWLETIAAVLTLAAISLVFVFRRLPLQGEPRSDLYTYWVYLILFQWGFLSLVVTVRLWRAGRGQPTVARRRMRSLAVASAGMALALVVSGSGDPGAEPGIRQLVTQVLAMLTAPLFLVSFAPPNFLRSSWRRKEEFSLREAELGLMRALTKEDVARALLPHATHLVGGTAGLLADAGGRVLAHQGLPETEAAEVARGFPLGKRVADPNDVLLTLQFGWIFVKSNPYAPFFGKEEVEILQVLAVLSDLALARVDLLEREKRKNLFLGLLQEVTGAANTATRLDDALEVAIKEVCERLGCAAGHAFVLDSRSGRLRPTSIWFPADPEAFRDFKSVTAESDLAPGEGIHGVVYESGNPAWVEDLMADEHFIRGKRVKNLRLSSAVFVPARVGDKIEGVLEFFFEEPRSEDAELLGILERVGTQVGEIIRRQDSERILAERLEELARSNSELEQFAYVASHDLQEPLRMITSYLQLLVEGYSQSLDEKAEKYINYAVDGAKRMQELVQDLLTFSRVATHGKDPETVPADEALDTALHNLNQTVTETAAKINREPLPLVLADKGQLVQVFQNLIGNALKFSGENAPDISVSAQRNGSSWVFSVKDRGIGIAPRHAERIFTIFQRLHTKTEYPGTGIGLSICKKIIERHGGRIWVDSEPGAGAEFKFTLPVALRGS